MPKQPPEDALKVGVPQNLAIFAITGKHLRWSLPLIKLQTFKPAAPLKRGSNKDVFM